VKRTAARLADGRGIIYFDERDDAVRRLDDPRDLPAVSTSSQVRYDPLLGEWVAVASHRQGRTHLPPSDQCPLCPSTADRQTEVPAADYDVVVFENRFPSLSMAAQGMADGHLLELPTELPGEVLPKPRPGVGQCEVVCFTSDHSCSFGDLSTSRARLVVEAWVDRTIELSALPGVAQVFCFENRGQEIGVTLSHPHGQIYAYPFVTPRTRRHLEMASAHRARTGRNLFADVVAAEVRDGRRIVARSEQWTAFVPAASRWPFEVHCYPNRQVGDLPGLTDVERDDLAEVYLDLLRRFDRLFDSPMPYIAAWHQAPIRTDPDLGYLHLELFSVRREAGKLKYLAGSESGMGVFINDVPPERAAALLREAATMAQQRATNHAGADR